jgi:hypothetical protein
MADILQFKGKNAAVDPNVVLEAAKDQYDSLCIIGWNKDETLDLRASLNINHKDVCWLLNIALHKLLNGNYLE